MEMLSKRSYPLIVFLLISIGIFNILDYFLTMEVVIRQGHGEANPLIAAILHTPYFSLVKLMLVPLLLLFIWLVRIYLPRRALLYIGFTFLVYFSLMVYFKVVFF